MKQELKKLINQFEEETREQRTEYSRNKALTGILPLYFSEFVKWLNKEEKDITT